MMYSLFCGRFAIISVNSPIMCARLTSFSLRAHRYFHTNDSGLARPRVRLLGAIMPAVRRLIQVEDNVRRGRRDLRRVAETQSQCLREDLPV